MECDEESKGNVIPHLTFVGVRRRRGRVFQVGDRELGMSEEFK